jgi:integrase
LASETAAIRTTRTSTIGVIRLPLLAGTRRGETALAEWREFDLQEQGTSVWRIRAEHRKGQRGMKRGLVIPLPSLAVRLLLALREETGSGTRVFPAVGERFLINPYRSTEEVRKATGVRVSLHDLRATCATGVRRMSGLPHVPALVLGTRVSPACPT